MMMPANYSVIAENEMTYVNGGAFVDVLPDVMTTANWKTFNTNLVKIIGNSFMANFVSMTLGEIFGGSYVFGDVYKGIANKLTGIATENGAVTPWGVVNAGLQVIGGLASIYTLGTGSVSASAKTFEVV